MHPPSLEQLGPYWAAPPRRPLPRFHDNPIFESDSPESQDSDTVFEPDRELPDPQSPPKPHHSCEMGDRESPTTKVPKFAGGKGEEFERWKSEYEEFLHLASGKRSSAPDAQWKFDSLCFAMARDTAAESFLHEVRPGILQQCTSVPEVPSGEEETITVQLAPVVDHARALGKLWQAPHSRFAEADAAQAERFLVMRKSPEESPVLHWGNSVTHMSAVTVGSWCTETG